MDDFWWGKGVSDGRCIGRLFRHNRKYLVFRVVLKRGVVLSLHDLAKHAPFDSVSRRRGLADRVGAVTGVAIADSELEKLPAIPFETLSGPGKLEAYLQVLQSVVDQINQHID